MKLKYLLPAAVLMAACNGDKKDAADTRQETTAAIPPDRVRDGLQGNVTTYTYLEFTPARPQGDGWVADTTQPVVHTVYRYNSDGNIAEIAELMNNGKPSAGKRSFKYAEDGTLTYIMQTNGDEARSRTVRQWVDARVYIDRTLPLTEDDTSAWTHRTTVRLNDNWLLQEVTYQLSDTTQTLATRAASAYNSDGSLRSRTLYMGTDSIVITYTTLQKDANGNPTKTLKQYSDGRPPGMIVARYEY